MKIQFGVTIKRFDKLILEILFAIKISMLIKNSSGKPNMYAILTEINEIKITIKPYIVLIPIIGAASKLASQNIVENWLKFSNIIGIINTCADIVTVRVSFINLLILLLLNLNISNIFLLSNIIPKVPPI